MQLETHMAGGDGRMDNAELLDRPAGIVEAFVRNIEAGHIGSAINLLSRSIVASVGAQRLESILSMSSYEVGEFGGIESVEVQTRAFSRDHVEMLLTIWYGDHRVESETVELVRESNRWRISMEEVNMPLMQRV